MVYAAQVNAVMSDAAASDDSDLRTIVHCGTPLVATALAAAEHHGGTGEEVLAAIVVGYEASGRIIDAMTGFRERGFHGSQAAIFSATVAAARLLHLDAEQTTHAIALTATSSSGLAKAADTSVAREYHAGMATMAGIQAVRAAQRGYKAEERILEMKLGFFEAVGGVDGDEGAALATRDLRRIVGHRHRHGGQAGARRSPIPRAGRGRRQRCAQRRRSAPEEIESITVSRPGLTALSGPLHPKDLVDMAHSPAYFTAAGAADRDFSWANATPAKDRRPGHPLADRQGAGRPAADRECRALPPGRDRDDRASDGRSFTSTVYAPKGSGQLGIAWTDIDAKFRALMPHSGLPDRQVEASLAVIHDFRRVKNVSALTSLLQPREA